MVYGRFTQSVGATVEISEIESLAKGALIVGDGSGAPSTLNVGTNTHVLTADSGEATGLKWAAAAASSSLTRTATKTANYTAVAGDLVVCDANAAAGSFAVTLPASPSAGNTVGVLLLTDHATRKVTVGRNGELINGQADDTLFDLVIEGDYAEFVYEGGGAGWRARRDFTPIFACAKRDTTQAITTGTVTVVQLATEVLDNANCYDTSTYRFTARRAGKYVASGWAKLTLLSDARIFAPFVQVNGTIVADGYSNSSTTSMYPGASATRTLTLAVGDYVELSVYHDHGSNRDLYVADDWTKPRLEILEHI